MELKGDTAPLDENIWKWGEDSSSCIVDIKRLTDKITTPQLISIIHELQLHKLTIMEPNIDTINRWLIFFNKWYFDATNNINIYDIYQNPQNTLIRWNKKIWISYLEKREIINLQSRDLMTKSEMLSKFSISLSSINSIQK